MQQNNTATVIAGIPVTNYTLFHRIRFSVGDPAAFILLPNGQTNLLIRDIEMSRAKKNVKVDQVFCPADFTPAAGLSGDRETATAQALTELLVQNNITCVIADRTLPLIYAHHFKERNIELNCDLNLGILDRRTKDNSEIQLLREAQGVTEQVMEIACATIAKAKADAQGRLHHEGQPLTSEIVNHIINTWLLKKQYVTPCNIVAGGKDAGDCHNLGSGQLFTEQPIIVDIFPLNQKSRYNGDCTRTVVHGQVPEVFQKMHQAVVDAKVAATAAVNASATGHDVHQATIKAITDAGYGMGLPISPDQITMPHGTGHGVGLEVHESPLLDVNGPQLLKGDVLTIEPGLYAENLGGLRVEDMMVVTENGCENFNQLHQGLNWK